jgi:hypothetical protein
VIDCDGWLGAVEVDGNLGGDKAPLLHQALHLANEHDLECLER